jgi:hypothetical protein
MGHIDASVWVFVLAAGVTLLVFKPRPMAEKIIEAIDKFRGGGPPTPMHPSPAGDDALLRMRPGKVER